ncbi:MAG: hypothetical protein EHM40_00985 [Chloroflexi bacterium]|nr:MAG: hypothetical protein EHM40_00985 [Chloroflexota bacterium]
MKKHIFIQYPILVCLLLLAGCGPKTETTDANRQLTIHLLYPLETTEIEMGETFKSIIQVQDEQGRNVENAKTTLTVSDAAGKQVASLSSEYGSGEVYRTQTWAIPHKMTEGAWSLVVEAEAAAGQGTASGTFIVNNSTGEILLNNYGFWVDAPSLRGIVPTLMKERGDAQDGMIIWGGMIPTMHIFPENWLEVHWRAGDFKLQTADDVRRFVLDELGDLGFRPVRELGTFEPVRFKDWDAWQAQARGLVLSYDSQWMVFYSPEVDKTYAISTTVVQPPSGMDPHAVLRDGFEVHPEMNARGTAPEPLLRLLPPPKLISPELGTRVYGTEEPIVLRWEPVKELAEDEYYLVSVDYNYIENNPRLLYTTRETQFTLPESLYETPNCGVFNWRITLMRQTGVGEDGGPKGEPISFNSLYHYVEWRYPPGVEAPFDLRCPNEQF